MSPDAYPVDEPDASAPSLEDVLIESARLHAMRASILRQQVENPSPLFGRSLARLVDGRVRHRVAFAWLVAKRTGQSVIDDGPVATLTRIRDHLRPGSSRPVRTAPRVVRSSTHEVEREIGEIARKQSLLVAERKQSGPHDPAHEIYRAPTGISAGRVLRHRVLIVAELSIPQCAKYRVWQKKEHFERLGIPCTVVSCWRIPEALSLLQTHTLAILYRVAGQEGPLDLIDEAKRLGVETLWEIDDLIFDVVLYGSNANLRDLPSSLRREVLNSAVLYRRALLATDRSIGSTSVLAELMSQASGKPCSVVNNALDRETLAFAADAIAARQRDDDRVIIVYGSGTLTHDTDFTAAVPALLRLLADTETVHLRIIGTLNLPPLFDGFAGRVERLEMTNFRAYLAALAFADISIAPLEDTTFNDAKSNIKLIEAAIVGLPSVCSPRREFRDAIENGVDGFLAANDDEWFEALRALVADPALRSRVGKRARANVLERYAPHAIAAHAVRPLASLVPQQERAQLRILSVNLFFAPRSFGGATIVAEEMARRLNDRDDTEVLVFTSHNFPAPQYTLKRYVARGLHVIGIAMPPTQDDILNFDDPEMARRFADVLEAVDPDIVHLHAIQHFGAGIPRACQRAGVPYVITVHDAWWLCARQFMVRADNTYCYQTTIDLKVCERCMPSTHHLQSRMDILKQAMLGAAKVLSPSASHGALYALNGVPPEKLTINRNGIRLPSRQRILRQPGPIRFGYVGGNDPLKGMKIIESAFRSLDRNDWELVIVDNTLNLGFSNFKPRRWAMRGIVRVVPAYSQDTMDAFFQGIDVLLFPSQWKECFGLTVREALARDVWVLATESGGAAEQVVAGVNGTLIPMGNDPSPLAAAVAELLNASEMFENYVNPYKNQIASLDDQARELLGVLVQASGGGRPAAMAE